MQSLPSNPLPQILLQRMNVAPASPLWLACDSKNMFLGRTEQQWELYQALTSGYW